MPLYYVEPICVEIQKRQNITQTIIITKQNMHTDSSRQEAQHIYVCMLYNWLPVTSANQYNLITVDDVGSDASISWRDSSMRVNRLSRMSCFIFNSLASFSFLMAPR
jgi:hypothetical protein